MIEKWKKIPGNEKFMVSSYGDVKRIDGFIPKKSIEKCKFGCIYRVRCGDKHYRVHNLVFKVFNNICISKRINVCFTDGNTLNPKLENLSHGKQKKIIKKIKGEIWKESIDAPGYFISNLGRVSYKNFEIRLNWVKFGKEKELSFNYKINNKRNFIRVKTQVYKLFVDNEYSMSKIIYTDGDKKNNKADNLNLLYEKRSKCEILKKLIKIHKKNQDHDLTLIINFLNGDKKDLNKFYSDNYYFFLARARSFCIKFYKYLDHSDYVNDVFFELEDIIMKGRYDGKFHIKYYVLGAIKNRIRRAAKKSKKSVSIFDKNGRCIIDYLNK